MFISLTNLFSCQLLDLLALFFSFLELFCKCILYIKVINHKSFVIYIFSLFVFDLFCLLFGAHIFLCSQFISLKFCVIPTNPFLLLFVFEEHKIE